MKFTFIHLFCVKTSCQRPVRRKFLENKSPQTEQDQNFTLHLEPDTELKKKKKKKPRKKKK